MAKKATITRTFDAPRPVWQYFTEPTEGVASFYERAGCRNSILILRRAHTRG